MARDLLDHALLENRLDFSFYHELDRLSRATDLSATDLFTYGYDAAGNRLSKTNAAGPTSYT